MYQCIRCGRQGMTRREAEYHMFEHQVMLRDTYDPTEEVIDEPSDDKSNDE